MVKTRTDLKGIRVSAKAPRKMPASSSGSGGSGRSSRKYEGGNSYFPRETPPWQKEITRFFTSKASTDSGGSSTNNADTELGGPSTSSSENTEI